MPNPLQQRVSLRARFVIPVEQSPIAGGTLTVRGEQILEVGQAAPDDDVLDLGSMAILPAFINTHTHLEFSQLDQPLGYPGMPFSDWIRAVLKYREQQTETSEIAVSQGLAESAAVGTAALGEIVTYPLNRRHAENSHVHTVCFHELIGLSTERVQQQCERAHQMATELNATTDAPSGLSPHAPYTAHRHLVSTVTQLSADHGVPVAMHLAETREEIQLLMSQSRPLHELLVERNVWQPQAFTPGIRPLDYLHLLAQANHTLIIHGNFLDEEEMHFIGTQRNRMTVVYCPRTHAYFPHPEYPLRTLLDAKIRVVLGTDSRASNPDLQMLSEMRCVAKRHSQVSAKEILRMGTMDGAMALGVENSLGSLAPGKQASFVAVQLPTSTESAAEHLVLDHELPIELVVLKGQIIFASDSTRAIVGKVFPVPS